METVFDTQSREMLSRLQEIATQRGISYAQISEKTGWAPGAISRIMTGKHHPTLPTLLRLADAIGVSISLEENV